MKIVQLVVLFAAAATSISCSPLPLRLAITVGDPPNARYAALGDSITNQGVNRPDGWVNQYLGTENVFNGGRSGWTSFEILEAVRREPGFNDAFTDADRITLDIGINDFFHARNQYLAGTCSGGDNQDCLRAMVQRFAVSFDGIIAELRRDSPCVLLSVGDLYSVGYLDRPAGREDPGVLAAYEDAMNAHIHASGEAVANIDSAFGDSTGLILPDAVHPNEEGQNVIAHAFADTRPVRRC